MASQDKFSRFNIQTIAYKEVQGHKINLDILIPKNLTSGTYPLIVRFHGGFLISSASLYPDWFQPWLVEYALQHKAIMVSPNYRLMPEAAGLDVLEDLSDIWSFVHGDLQTRLGNGLKVSYDQILVTGDSAGGWLAVQSALSPFTKAQAVITSCPMIDIKIPFFTTAFERSILGFPMMPADKVDNYIANLKGKPVVSSASPPDRLDLALAAIQHGKYAEILGEDPSLYPMHKVKEVESIPPMLIMHGMNDSAVPYRSSEAFVEQVKAVHPETRIMYKAVPDLEHGFDLQATLETHWLKDGLDFITPIWLGSAANGK
ncbi:Alpha/Beta hydrolase protein [Ilyonectria destructans]|nr:Alpha/Beta hydrolase protein [Ilyonectria destructans]